MTAATSRPELFPGLPVTEGMLVPTDRALPPVPLKHTDVQATIIGPLCDVQVTQQFHHTHTRPIEAIYVFPLPEDASVTDLTLTIGERVIRGVIQEREQARRNYEQARTSGQGAALLEQERPNLFTVSVANIQPDQHVEVMLRFHDRVAYDDGRFEFVFPTVVLPRYVPQDMAGSADAGRVTATPLLPADMRDGHTLNLTLMLDAGSVEDISSPTHGIDMATEHGITRVALREEAAIPNKDFMLRYRVAGDQFKATPFTYRPQGQPGTVLLMLTPRAELAPEDILPRELLFVFDRSGSMGGDSIVQARNALRACLRALNPADTFNIFPFDNHVEQFAPQSLAFTQEHIDRADAYIEQINARGGTEILGALQQALAQPRDTERLRVVVFMTDGAVGNEDQVLRELGSALNEARVYAFGIGSAVNRFLLDKLAEVGRGSVEYIFPGQAIEDAVQRFQNRAAFPVLVDLALDWGTARITDVYPNPLPDLYAGQPLSLLARFHTQGASRVRLSGRSMHGSFEQVLDIEWPAATPDRSEHWATLPQVWARARLDALMTQERHAPAEQSKLRDQILSLALEYSLMSPYTSLVAIEEQRADHADRAKADRVLVPIHLPQGTLREAFEMPGAPMSPMAMGMMPASAPPMFSQMVSRSAKMHRSPSAPPTLSENAEFFADSLAAAPSPADPGVFGAAPVAEPSPLSQPSLSKQQRYDQALRYLARTQGVSGAWGESAVATALVVLAFLQGGHTDRAGNFMPQLTRATRWLIEQAKRADVAPAVAWTLAVLADKTAATAHTSARDTALTNATPADDLDRNCLALARGEHIQTPAEAQRSFTSERDALALALHLFSPAAPVADIAATLEGQQQTGGSNAGAVVAPGLSAAHRDAAIFAMTASSALAWSVA